MENQQLAPSTKNLNLIFFQHMNTKNMKTFTLEIIQTTK